MTAEQKARQKIDLLLHESGWIVQDRRSRNIAAGPCCPRRAAHDDGMTRRRTLSATAAVVALTACCLLARERHSFVRASDLLDVSRGPTFTTHARAARCRLSSRVAAPPTANTAAVEGSGTSVSLRTT